MARTEDGEFELILGNRQLLSVFFIVVVLLGVFFTMGYIVGKNSTAPENYAKQREPIVVDPTNPTPRNPTGSEASKPSPLEPVPSKPEATKPEITEPKPLPSQSVKNEEAAREAARREEQRRQEEARLEEARKREEARKEELARKEKSKKEEKKEPPRKTEEPSRAPVGGAPALLADGSPAPGQQFLQVVASTRPDCEFIAGVLKRKGLVATVVPGPDSKLFRVVVGPLSDAATISKTRSEIEKAGFQNPYLKRY